MAESDSQLSSNLATGAGAFVSDSFLQEMNPVTIQRMEMIRMVAGIVMYLLGQIHTLVRQSNFKVEDINESIINRARIIFRTNIDQDISIEKVAEELNVSYAWFRKAFKAYSGIAPHQYVLQLKIEKAKALLADPSIQVKEISFSLNFKSTFYFSKLFKEKTGSSPAEFRKKMKRKK